MEDQEGNERVLFRINYLLKRLMDRYVTKNLAQIAQKDFSITFMPYFMAIGEQGISNHELVHKIKVTKQGVSKNVKELEALGLVYSEKGESDARSLMIHLTEPGKDLYRKIKDGADTIKTDYIKVLGAKNYEVMVDSMLKLIDYFEQLEEE